MDVADVEAGGAAVAATEPWNVLMEWKNEAW